MTPVPSPEEQVLFLQRVQRLLSEGLFVASYKFALLKSLADLAVLKGDDSGKELELSVEEIAKVFVELYWRQTRPVFATGGLRGSVLRQNTGEQAAIITAIASAQAECRGSLPRLQQDSARWNYLVREVATTIRTMPLWKLQRVGDDVIDFLYPNIGKGKTICLRAGVAYCLRNFYEILRNLIEGAWVNYVRAQNLELLGPTTDLVSFLFGVDRTALGVYRPVLAELQLGTCFYCRQSLRGAGAVDHFIPWSKYPVDLGHNFVLAHERCNAKKRDFLAGEDHLAFWLERNDTHREALQQFFERSRVANSLESSVSIARWAYTQTARADGLVWLRGNEHCHLGSRWKTLLAVM